MLNTKHHKVGGFERRKMAHRIDSQVAADYRCVELPVQNGAEEPLFLSPQGYQTDFRATNQIITHKRLVFANFIMHNQLATDLALRTLIKPWGIPPDG